MQVNFNQLIKSCGTRTVPAADIKSIGLQADPDTSVGAGALGVMVFAIPS
jgi:hypothetical protein